MQYLIGMITTMLSFAAYIWIINRRQSESTKELLGHWRVSNKEAMIKNETLKVIAKHLENLSKSREVKE